MSMLFATDFLGSPEAPTPDWQETAAFRVKGTTASDRRVLKRVSGRALVRVGVPLSLLLGAQAPMHARISFLTPEGTVVDGFAIARGRGKPLAFTGVYADGAVTVAGLLEPA